MNSYEIVTHVTSHMMLQLLYLWVARACHYQFPHEPFTNVFLHQFFYKFPIFLQCILVHVVTCLRILETPTTTLHAILIAAQAICFFLYIAIITIFLREEVIPP